MKRKIISIILIIAVSLPMFRVHTVKSSASLPEFAVKVIEAILVGTAGAVAGAAAYSMGEVLAENLAPGGELDVQNAVSTLKTLADVDVARYVTNIVDTDGITVYVDTSGNYYASASSSLTGDELELATKICDNLNSIPNFSELCEQTDGGAIGGSTIAGGGGTSVLAYEKIKSAVGNAVSELVQQKALAIAKENGLTLMSNGALPVYNFDFVGPMQPGLELPILATTAKEFSLDGFSLTRPYTYTGYKCYKKEEAVAAGFNDLLETGDGWVIARLTFDDYAGINRYFIYNGDIFYCPLNNFGTLYSGYVDMNSIMNGDMSTYKNVNGVSLASAGATAFEGLQTGFFYTRNTDTSYTAPTTKVDDFSYNSFTSSVTPGTVEIPRTEGESAVTNGLNTGLISSNPQLVLDENGNIARVDGIDTAKLMELLQTIANNGNISFDSIEGYLQHITQLLMVSNADANTLNTVVTNLKDLSKAQSKSISEINTAVQSIVEAITAEKAANLDFETPEVSIFDKFPFSLPWDFYRIVSLLCTEEKAPVFTIPIKTKLNFGSLNYDVNEKIVLDLTIFKINGVDVVQVFTTTTSYLFFLVCLIFATKKLIWK